MSLYPLEKTLSSLNYALWEEYILSGLTQFPKAGLAIVNKTKYSIYKPTVTDCFPDMIPEQAKYTFKNGILTSESRRDFRSDYSEYKKEIDHFQIEEAKTCTYLKSSLSDEAILRLKNNKDFLIASNQNDSYGMYLILQSTYQSTNNFSQMSKQAKSYVALKQENLSFLEYKDQVLRNLKLFTYNFQNKTHPEFISINDLAVVLFCRGLDHAYFQYPLDSLYATLTPSNLPPLDDIIQIFQDYTTQKEIPLTEVIPHNTPTDAKISAISMGTTIKQSDKICEECKVTITNINFRTKIANKLCGKCYRLKQKASSSTEIPAITTPTINNITIQQAQEVLSKAKDNLRSQAALLNSHLSHNSSVLDVPFPSDDINPYSHLALSNLQQNNTELSTPLFKSFYYDSCCTYTSTSDFCDLTNPRKLTIPITMDSSSGHPVSATHVGILSNFPIPMDVYYCPNAAHKLLSLGALVRSGGTFTIRQPSGNLDLYNLQGALIDTSPLLPNNTWVCNLITNFQPKSCNQTTITYTKEMIKRATQCRALHIYCCHPCNGVLKQIIHYSIFGTYTILVPADVDLMHNYFGECIQCIQGKQHKLSVPLTSISFPELAIGEKVFFDFKLLPVMSRHNRNTQSIIFCDSKCTFTSVLGSQTKTTPDILTKCLDLVSIYRAHGHIIKAFSTDCENICISLRQQLGDRGIAITVTTPEEHSHKIERIIQELDCKVTATLCSLSYVFPSNLLIYLQKAIVTAMNLSHRSTTPNSPCAYVEFYSKKPILTPNHPFLAFGTTVMFHNTLSQRQAQARVLNLHINNVAKSQLGINIGIDYLHPGCNLFFTPLSPVPLPRDNFIPVQCHPFGYTPQEPLIPIVSIPSNTLTPITNITNNSIPSDIIVPQRPTRTIVPPARFLTNLSTTEQTLYITPKHSTQCTLKQAYLKFAQYVSEIKPAVDKEIHKLFVQYPALQVLPYNSIPQPHNFYRLFGFMKEKVNAIDGSHKSLNYRIVAAAAKSNFLETESYGSAPTSDHNLFMLTITAIIAYAIQKNILSKLFLRQYDLPAAFLQVNDTSKVPCYGRMPSDIGPPYANCYVHFKRCIYGTPQANALFFADHDAILKQIGYTPCELDPCKYIIIDRSEHTYVKLCVISTHVDDGGAVGTDRDRYERTLIALRRRYGDITESLMTGYLGINMELDKTLGSLKCDLAVYIENFLSKCNIDNIPTKSTPYPMNLFDQSNDDDLTPVDISSYQTVIGYVIFSLKIRTDINLSVIQAASHNACPTKADLVKLVHLLGYLKAHSSLGPTFYTTDGPILIAGCDVAFAVHKTGSSQISMSFRIGENSAAFHVTSFAQKTCVSLNPTHSEYFGISHCVEVVETYRNFLSWLGFPQLLPTIIETDSKSSIFIGEADLFPKKSKNILVKHRNVKLALSSSMIKLRHDPSETNMNDLNAKPNAGPSFILKRAKLMNLPL